MSHKLFGLDKIAKRDAVKYPKKRFVYEKLNKWRGKEFVSLIGPRGVGKTVLLRQLSANTKNSFYLSMDTFEEKSLFDFVKFLSEKYGIESFLMDEIHFYKNYDADLKKIFDFLNVRVLFTSSVSLSLYESAYDLSRRVQSFDVYPFSFREYVYFKEDIKLPALSLSDILAGKWSDNHLKKGYLFEEYIKGGLYPFSLESADTLKIMRNVLKKIVSKDIPVFANLKMEEIDFIDKTFKFTAISHVEDVNYSTIAKNIGITKHKSRQYVDLLDKSFVFNAVMPHGTNVLKEPKVLIAPPYRMVYKEYGETLGALREDFAVQCLKMRGHDVLYLKSPRGEKTPDFFIREKEEKLVIEVGGKGKGRTQFKDFKGYKKLVLSGGGNSRGELKRHLFLLGYF